jgi:hypothetical protein
MSLDELNTVFSRISLLEEASLIIKMLFEFWNSLFKFILLYELNVFDMLVSFVLENGLFIKILLELENIFVSNSVSNIALVEENILMSLISLPL